MKCLDDRQLNQYASGSMDPRDLVAASSHVNGCECCKSRVLDAKIIRGAGMSVGSTVLGISDCPEYEELSAYVDGKLVPEAQLSIDRHILTCELCEHDVNAIQTIRARASLAPQMEVHPGRFAASRTRSWFAWPRAVAMGGCAVAAVAVVMFTQMKPAEKANIAVVRPTPPVVAPTPDTGDSSGNDSGAKTPVAVADPEKTPLPQAAQNDRPNKPVYRVAMSDGDVVVKESNGKYSVNLNERVLSDLVDRKLRSGKLPSRFQLAQAVTPGYRGPADVIDVDMVSPQADAVVDSSLTFKWQSVDDADRYRVEIYTFDGTPVFSEETTGTAIKTKAALPGGGYKWVVRVRSGEAADWKWSKSQTFRVLSAEENDMIETAVRQYPGSHLVLGSVYEHLGLNDKAVAEFKSLSDANPKSKLAKKLLRGAMSAH